MKINKNSNILIFLIIVLLAVIIFLGKGLNNNFWVLITSFIISSFSVFKVLSNKAQLFSLNLIFYLFNLFFIGLAPALQYKSGIFFLGENSRLTDYDFLIGNLIFIACISLYEIIYTVVTQKHLKEAV